MSGKRHREILFGKSASERALPLTTAPDVITGVEVSAGTSRGNVLSEEVGSNLFVADITVERPSMLMLKATYHPNRRAKVDGVETDTVMLMPSFLGIQVNPGHHEVRLEYMPRRLRMILLIMGLLTFR